jgi:uncharacterized protein
MPATFGLFAKFPKPGLVKTRLAAALGNERAAEAAHAFLCDLADRFRYVADRRTLCIAPAHDEARSYFARISNGAYELWPQPEASLGERLAQFFKAHLTKPDTRVVVIGSDSPTLPGDFVERAFSLLNECECVIGPAEDGGYYLLGMRGQALDLFSDIAWSGPTVLEETLRRLDRLGAKRHLLPAWYDVDTADDWERLCRQIEAMSPQEAENSLPKTRQVATRGTRHDPKMV